MKKPVFPARKPSAGARLGPVRACLAAVPHRPLYFSCSGPLSTKAGSDFDYRLWLLVRLLGCLLGLLVGLQLFAPPGCLILLAPGVVELHQTLEGLGKTNLARRRHLRRALLQTLVASQ